MPGRKAYIGLPLVEEFPRKMRFKRRRAGDHLAPKVFPAYRVGLLHDG